MPNESAFFYGTLCHPTILQRVIGNLGTHLLASPAVLLDYTRHHVDGADYPAIIPYARTRELINGELSPEDRSVRGTLVSGLTPEDMRLLDVFEGTEYTRERVHVHPLGTPTSLASPGAGGADLVPATPPPLPPREELPEALEAGTYVWRSPIRELRPELWSFELFVKENAWKWVGDGSRANEDFEKVDEVRWAGRPAGG